MLSEMATKHKKKIGEKKKKIIRRAGIIFYNHMCVKNTLKHHISLVTFHC